MLKTQGEVTILLVKLPHSLVTKQSPFFLLILFNVGIMIFYFKLTLVAYSRTLNPALPVLYLGLKQSPWPPLKTNKNKKRFYGL